HRDGGGSLRWWGHVPAVGAPCGAGAGERGLQSVESDGRRAAGGGGRQLRRGCGGGGGGGRGQAAGGRAEGGGSFGGCVAGAKAGDGYKLVLQGQGQVMVKADPRARQVKHSNGASVVVDARFPFSTTFEA